MASQAEKGAAFRALHEREGAFIIPNPWDVGTAIMMQGMGFEALATTSSGYATTLGRFDGQVTRDEKLEHCRQISNAVNIPVSADMENCFADSPEGVAETIRLAGETGLVGCSIEDYDNKPEPGIYDFDLSVARVKAGVEAANALDFPFTVTARAEGVLRKKHDLDEAIRRLKAFEEVGAHVLYAPGLTTNEDVRKVIDAVLKPVNVLTLPHFKVDELAAAGAKRISLGGWLARVATGGWLRAAQEMKDAGTFTELNNAASGKDVANVLKPK
ncbi:MAG: isocitrate lyase/phosphoenolpyruvate mutase family protein [Pseudomonadota bacterium]